MKYFKSKTSRGFGLVQFYDDYDELCDIQRSSSAEASKIWLGTHNVCPKILASKTEKGGTGWVEYPIPSDVFINHRMHLTRKQSISLAFKLLKFGLLDKLS
jgi:hypothetical protein